MSPPAVGSLGKSEIQRRVLVVVTFGPCTFFLLFFAPSMLMYLQYLIDVAGSVQGLLGGLVS